MYMYCKKCDAIRNIKSGYKVKYIGSYQDVRQVKATCPKCSSELTAQYRV